MRRMLFIILTLLIFLLPLAHARSELQPPSCRDVNHATEDCVIVACHLSPFPGAFVPPVQDAHGVFSYTKVSDPDLVYETGGAYRTPDNVKGSSWKPIATVKAYRMTGLNDYKQGTICELPAFNLTQCSIRGDLYLITRITRYYTASGKESNTLTTKLALTCTDMIPPNATLKGYTVDWVRGSLNLTVHITDNETLLLTKAPETIIDSAPYTDTTKLASCSWQLEGPKGTTPKEMIDCRGKLEVDANITLTHDLLRKAGCFNQPKEACQIILHLADGSGGPYAIPLGWTCPIDAPDCPPPQQPSTPDIVENNRVVIRIPLPVSLYDALGGGYCPRENECLANPDSLLIGNNTFSSEEGFISPVCVKPGEGVNDYFCTKDGVDSRLHQLIRTITPQHGEFSLVCLPKSFITQPSKSGTSFTECPADTLSPDESACDLTTLCLLTTLTPAKSVSLLASPLSREELYNETLPAELDVRVPFFKRSVTLKKNENGNYANTLTDASGFAGGPWRVIVNGQTRFFYLIPDAISSLDTGADPLSPTDLSALASRAVRLINQQAEKGVSFKVNTQRLPHVAYATFSMSQDGALSARAFIIPLISEKTTIGGPVKEDSYAIVAYYEGYTPRLCTGEAEDTSLNAPVYCEEAAQGTLLVRPGGEDEGIGSLIPGVARAATTIAYPLVQGEAS